MNAIEYVTKERMREIRDCADNDPDTFLVELFGAQLPTEELFMHATVEAVQYPYPKCELKIGWYNDYICDLLWINEPHIVMLVHDFDLLLKENQIVKQWWLDDLKRIVLPWWDGEVIGHMMGGYPREFNVYIELKTDQ